MQYTHFELLDENLFCVITYRDADLTELQARKTYDHWRRLTNEPLENIRAFENAKVRRSAEIVKVQIVNAIAELSGSVFNMPGDIARKLFKAIAFVETKEIFVTNRNLADMFIDY